MHHDRVPGRRSVVGNEDVTDFRPSELVDVGVVDAEPDAPRTDVRCVGRDPDRIGGGVTSRHRRIEQEADVVRPRAHGAILPCSRRVIRVGNISIVRVRERTSSRGSESTVSACDSLSAWYLAALSLTTTMASWRNVRSDCSCDG